MARACILAERRPRFHGFSRSCISCPVSAGAGSLDCQCEDVRNISKSRPTGRVDPGTLTCQAWAVAKTTFPATTSFQSRGGQEPEGLWALEMGRTPHSGPASAVGSAEKGMAALGGVGVGLLVLPQLVLSYTGLRLLFSDFRYFWVGKDGKSVWPFSRSL